MTAFHIRSFAGTAVPKQLLADIGDGEVEQRLCRGALLFGQFMGIVDLHQRQAKRRRVRNVDAILRFKP
ncbi:hypothetical protein D3C81_858260 [compost metagenome]